jgi:hypothetical protein
MWLATLVVADAEKILPLKRMLATQSVLSYWSNCFRWWLTKTFIHSDSCSVEMEQLRQPCLLAILFNDKMTGCVGLFVMKEETVRYICDILGERVVLSARMGLSITSSDYMDGCDRLNHHILL